MEVDEELIRGFREIVDEGEEFTWDSLIDEEEDVFLGMSQDEPTVVD